ncbi:MAG TPA: response regulator transcription factor, partial [Saprospiraceae bacterium]|nr:response regulator transcription factor [Saprospiraceae bacterium]
TAKAISLAHQAIEILENGFPTRERALAYSNLSQLYMLCEDRDNTLLWGNKAIDLATRMEDHEIVSHALNNVGNTLLQVPSSENQGEQKLNQSLSIALEKGFHEHAARAYVNLGSSFVLIKRYEKAMAAFDAGFKYCDERDLDFLKFYMLGYKAQLLLETGHWDEAEIIAKRLQLNQHHLLVKLVAVLTLSRLAIRQGKFEDARILIEEAKVMAMPTHEAQRIIPVLTAALELAWISGDPIPLDEIRKAESTLFYDKNYSWHYSMLAYWMNKCGVNEADTNVEFNGPFKFERDGDWKTAAEQWEKIGSPYEQALAMINGDEEHQKQALLMLHEMDASATYEMLKSKLRLQGVKNIPRGPRESTRSNPAQLTNRQIDVLNLLKEGLQNTEIADKLFISSKTVDHHISSILSKLEVNTRQKAVSEARRLGILN